MTDLRDRAISKAHSIYRSYTETAGIGKTDRLAFLFFLLELYKRTEDARVREKMLVELSLLEKHLAERGTDSYTLPQGSFGIAFFYLRLFKHAGNDEYLNRANSIVLEYYKSESFKCGFIDSHSLFGGIAGILLVSVELYLRKNDPSLLQHIEMLLLRLIKNAHEGHTGIYWGGMTNKGKTNIGLAAGAAGVAIPLTILGNVFGHKFLAELSGRAVEYEEAVRLADNPIVTQDKEAVNTALKKSSCCYGIAGLMVAKLYQGSGPIDRLLFSYLQDTLAGHHSISAEITEDDSFGLFSGISGIGLAFIEAYRYSGDEKYRKEAENIAERILGTAGYAGKNRTFPAEEQLGIGYFLLQLAGDYDQDSALLPDPRIKYTASTEDLPFDSIFKPGSPVMFETLIRKDFNRTFQILNAYIPDGLDLFLRQKTDSYYDDFARYVETILSEEQDFSKRENLLLNFESERFGLSISNGMQDCIPDDDDTILRIDRLLRLDEADFLSLTLVHADKFRIYSGEKTVNLEDRFTKETFPMFMTQYGSRTFIYAVNDLDVLEQSSLGIYKLMFDQFVSPTSIHEAHRRLADFLMTQNSDVLDMIGQQFIARYDQGIEELVSGLVLDGIRYCMMTGLLDVC